MDGKSRPMLDPPKTLLLGGSDQLTVTDQRSGRISVKSVQPENNQLTPPKHQCVMLYILRHDYCKLLWPLWCTSQISFHECQRYVLRIRSPEAADEYEFLTHVFSRIIVRIAQRIRQEFMACVTHAPQIDLRFGDPARQFLDFGVGACPGNFARERFAQGWVGANGKAQPVAKRVSRRSSAALGGLRAGTGPRVGAVGLPLAVGRQVASFPFSGVVPINLYWPPRCLARSFAALRPEPSATSCSKYRPYAVLPYLPAKPRSSSPVIKLFI